MTDFRRDIDTAVEGDEPIARDDVLRWISWGVPFAKKVIERRERSAPLL